jgi:two-component system NtrC family sensor kinase
VLLFPLVCGMVALQLFPAPVLERWLAAGFLLLADGLLVGLALLGTTRPRLVPLLGLAAVFALATLVADRTKTVIAGGALVLGLGVLGAVAPWPAVALQWIDAIHLPLLGLAAAHFGHLAERLTGSNAARARRESRELWALLEISDTITSSLDVSDVMHSIVERVGNLVDAPSCSILLARNPAADCFVVASKGHPEANMLELDLAKYPEIRHAIRTRQPVVIEDVALHPLVAPVRELLLAKGHRSLLVLPLLYGKEVVGALFLKSRRVRRFPPAELRFCKVAAGVSANALKNAILFRDVKETGEKLRRILDATPDLIVATDAAGRVAELNRGAETLAGRPAERALGRPLAELLGAADGALRLDDGGPQEVKFTRPDGAEVEISLVSAALSGPTGDAAGRVWIGRDVTKLRRVERSLAQAERLSSLGEIVAGVAHELNNPLSGVVGYAELLRAHASDPEQIADLQRIVESAMRCQRIVLKLLSFARKQPPEKRLHSLNECVTKVLDLKSYHLRSSRIETVLALDPALPPTAFDFQQIEQVILNLLNNAEQAISAVRRSGRIELRSGVEQGMIFLEIEDSGPGVPREVRDRIFDPFFSTKALGQGTGLGLSVSYGIVQEHGGRIELAARGGAGACFRVWLPIVAGHRPEQAAEVRQVQSAAGALRGRRVLVAEDEATVRELFARVLAQEGAEVVQAQDGAEAWARLVDDRFDLVIADVRMPNLDGQQLYERVAAERPDLLRRFVFATGDLVRADTLTFLSGLPNRILTKPLEIETVRRVLSQALDAAA